VQDKFDSNSYINERKMKFLVSEDRKNIITIKFIEGSFSLIKMINKGKSLEKIVKLNGYHSYDAKIISDIYAEIKNYAKGYKFILISEFNSSKDKSIILTNEADMLYVYKKYDEAINKLNMANSLYESSYRYGALSIIYAILGDSKMSCETLKKHFYLEPEKSKERKRDIRTCIAADLPNGNKYKNIMSDPCFEEVMNDRASTSK
jgi:tetratricopeptide (TPR) repeat protein